MGANGARGDPKSVEDSLPPHSTAARDDRMQRRALEVTETIFAASGLYDRPWSPAHLRCTGRADGGFDLSWVARLRVGGDRWDLEPALVEGFRFRISILDGDVRVRRFEVEGLTAHYAGPDATADFPGGAASARVAVAQWSDAFGWGVETVRNLV